MSYRPALTALALLGALALARPALAQAPTDAARAEAHDRFDRGIRLFNDGDTAAALAELERVYQIAPNPVVLYNVGLVRAAMGRSADAVDALDRVLAAPGALSADHLARARTAQKAQAARVATLAVTVNVPGAAVEIDNLEAGRAPLAKPLRVSSGAHVVAVVAPGHVPQRREVTLAGQTETALAFDLVPMDGKLAHLTIATRLPGAEVVVDGALAGRTPLPASLALAPGAHTIALRRAGYAGQRRELTLGDGASGEIAMELEEDTAAVGADGGTLSLSVSEPLALVSVDGRSRGADATSLRLAAGAHRLRVERSGFAVVERDVEVPARGVTRLSIALEPNPDTLAAVFERARTRRVWGIVAVAGGAAFVGASSAFLAYDAGPRAAAQQQLDRITQQQSGGAGQCKLADCTAQLEVASGNVNAYKIRDGLGYTGVALGVIALAGGVVLLAGGDDPHRYERNRSSETLARATALPVAWPLPGGGGVGVSGAF